MFNDTLGRMLFEHSINNWFKYSDSFKADIVVLDPQRLGYDRNYYNSSVCNNSLIVVSKFIPVNFRKIIFDCINFVKRNLSFIDNPIDLIYKLIKLRNQVKVISYTTSPDGVKNLSEIKHCGYNIYDNSINWSKFIPLRFVIYKTKLYCIDKKLSEKLGYGINSFQLTTDDICIRTIKCEGEHPNVNPSTKSYCAGHEILCKPINVRFLDSIRFNLQYANLDSPYNIEKVTRDLLPLL